MKTIKRHLTIAVPVGAVNVNIDSVTMDVTFTDARGYDVPVTHTTQRMGREPRNAPKDHEQDVFTCIDYGRLMEHKAVNAWGDYSLQAFVYAELMEVPKVFTPKQRAALEEAYGRAMEWERSVTNKSI